MLSSDTQFAQNHCLDNAETPLIKAKQLSHYFGSSELRKRVLSDIDLSIFAGEIVIISGPSGSGKTTLLTLIGGLRSVQAGSLKLLGKEMKKASKPAMIAVRQQIGYVFQAHNLLTFLTAKQNVRMSLELHSDYLHQTHQDIDQLAIDTLTEVGLGDRIDYPINKLSGGQKQRVGIARALASYPKIVLADEPTASLDRQSGRDVVDIMYRLAKERGSIVLLVTHDDRILDVADRILHMEDGRLLSAA
ncbi:ATP-binding cassette domain-containing protein [cf. Phormidesmis sp. LEGE 11477]|uniref:ATP-binding cassette domain-containing protein n=1 Tax=cf. Phormidesmis sp. LEGE 11477 TaxID=1828680 RepID=UPI0018819014|nr:ATP-binding cassette domain-containing protein [cf. Phormidesmis sp. LEGE 11477]MBE9060619.1 ATP-binding cassette domain-containing protein [cf. Phormidesmis sp. LEGE 11477]